MFGAIFMEGIGIPMPGQTFLMLAAFYSTRGHFQIIPVLFIAWAATMGGSMIGYAIGRQEGRKLVKHYGRYIFIDPKQLHSIERFFRKYGTVVALAARFFDVSRQLNAVASGIAGMPWRRFLVYNAVGGALWVCLWGILTYQLGERVARLTDIFKIKQFYILLGITIAMMVVGYLMLRHHKR